MNTTHIIGKYTVTAERLNELSEDSAYFCIVYKDGKKVLSMTVHNATSPEEAAREASYYAV